MFYFNYFDLFYGDNLINFFIPIIPRYIIFIIPIILIFIIRSSINLRNKNFFFLFLFLLTTTNISANYDNRHVQKPHTVQALDLIKEKSSNNILVLPNSVLFQNYISTVSKAKFFIV